MVRITCLNPGVRPAVLKVEGRLSGPWVDVLDRMVAVAAQGTERVVLDVSGVTFADAAGVEVLRRLTRIDAELRGGSLFLSSLLAGEAQ